MGMYVIEYEYSEDTALRDQLRPAHRDLMSSLAEQGLNLGSGVFGPDEPGGAMIVVRADSKDEALALTESDPFRTGGAVLRVSAREFIPYFGPIAGL